MKLAKHSSPAGLSWLWPLFIFIAALPVLSHWVRAAALDPDPLPGGPLTAMGGGTCSASGPGSCATGNCPKPPLWEVETVTATAAKCGFMEFTSQNLLPSNVTLINTNGTDAYVINGPPVFYLTSKVSLLRTDFLFIGNANQYTGWWGGHGYSVIHETVNSPFFYTATHIWDPTNCVELSADHSGSMVFETITDYIEQIWIMSGETNVTPPYSTTNVWATTITNAATGQWGGDIGFAAYGNPNSFCGYWGVPSGSDTRTFLNTVDLTTYVWSDTYTAEGTYPYGAYPPDPYEDEPQYYYRTNYLTGTNHYWLTNEFTDARAMQIALGKLEPFGSNWVTNASMIAELKMEPYSLTGTTNENLPGYWPPPVALASKFRARVTFETKTNASYKIGWTETYQPHIGAAYSISKSMVVLGTGSEMTVAIGEFVPTLGTAMIQVSSESVEDLTPTVAGSGTPSAGSLRLRLGLGSAGPIRGAGELHIHEALPSPALATPAVLQFIGLTNDVEVITDGSNWIRQARAPQTLADVVSLTTNAYEVRFYAGTNSGSLSNGLYVPTGSPFVVWGISGFATNTNLFRITETRGAGTITNDFEWAETNQSWTLTTGNGLRREVRSEVWSQTNTLQTITRTLLWPEDNALIARSVQTHYRFPFGLKLTSSTTGEEASPRTTTYAYYTSATEDGTSYGKLKTVVSPDGSWQWHEYDIGGRLAKTFSTFGNQSPTNNAALCRVTEYDYTPVGEGDDGTVQGWSPRTTIEKLLDTEVGRSFAVYKPGETQTARCQSAGGSLTWPDTLITTTCTYTNGSFKGWTKSERRPDGTMSLHEYEVDGATNLTTVVWSGQPNGAGTAVTNGTKLVTLQGPLGNVISRTTVDIASDIITGSETFSDFDEFGRPGRVTYLDSTFKLFTYICCGVESETDRDGVTTTYAYDAPKRRIGSYRNGIWHLNTLDAAGRTLSTQRQGTNASVITLASMAYDTAGRLLYQTNAVGNVTAYTETLDPRTESQVLPNGATRIQTYYKDGSLQSLTGTAVHGVRYEYGVESGLAYTKEIKLLTDGTDSSEWTKSFTDMAGRQFKTVYADDAYTQSYFNNAGQLWKQVDPDGVVTLYQYNALGEVEYTALDMDRNDTIDFDGTDRITRTVRRVGQASSLSSINAFISERWEYPTAGSTNQILTSLTERAVDGTRTWQTAFGLTSQSVSLCGGACVATNIAPDGSYTTTVKTNGYLMAVTRYDSQGTQLGATTYTYDEHGRQKTITDARNGTTTLIYDDADRVTSVTTPVPASGQSSQTTTSYYDELGRVWKTVQPDSTSVTNEFHLTGELKKTYGSRTYPVEYTYDYAGRMKTLKTWQDFVGNAGTATTTWNYSSARGWLTGKLYADDQGPTYTYTSAGRLATRVWARGITTTYTYDYAGQLTQTSYDDSVTPTAYTSYDRQGRVLTLGDGTLTTTRTYSNAGQLLAESHAGGVLDGLSITNTYDHLLRRTNLTSLSPIGQTLSATQYGYDNASRLSTVSDGTNNATYGYLANSPLVDSILFKQNTTTRMTRTNRYDYLNRLTSIASSAGGSNVSAFSYAYNDANQRVAVTNVDNSRWSWGYDALGQVTSGKKYWSDNGIVAGQQFEYAFDSIGNRTSSASGGNQFGTSLRTNTYAANALNQYTNRTVAGYVEAQGSANSSATVTVNNESTYRKGEYFRKELGVNNTSAAVWQGLTNIAVLAGAGTNGTDIVSTQAGSVLVPKTPEAFTYDADGNMTSDGRFTYTWDAENRLLTAESLTNAPAAARVRVQWHYQPDGRWSQRTAATWDGSAYVPNATNRFVWDGQVLLAVLDGDNQTTQAYLRGSDLSGSLAGAGGVGGLLAVSAGANGVHFAAFDGNGNVSALLSANSSTLTANYEYGPFGETLRATGPMALVNSLRFSTQFADDATGHFKYLYREYLAEVGRWFSRDPAEEHSVANLFSMVRNSPINRLDVLGLDDWVGPPAPLPAPNTTIPVDQYNCGGLAFGTYTYWSYADTVAKLATCSTTSKKTRCPCGERKCKFLDLKSATVTKPGTTFTATILPKQPDYHVVCGDEDGFQAYSKNGKGPLSGVGTIEDNNPMQPSLTQNPGYLTTPNYTESYYCCKK